MLKIGLLWYIIKKTEKSNSRLFWGIIISAVGLAIAGYGQYLLSYVYNTPQNPSTTPFYVGISALLLIFLGMVLFMQGIINRKKQNPQFEVKK